MKVLKHIKFHNKRLGMQRVFITGRGMTTPLGATVAVNEAALRNGVCGI